MPFELRDGTGIEIRPIRPDDKDLLARGWALLSPQTQQQRFLTAKPRLTNADLRYLTEVDGAQHVALHCGYVVARVKARFPDQKVIVGRWGRGTDLKKARTLLLSAGADRVTATLREARAYLARLVHPLFPAPDLGPQAV